MNRNPPGRNSFRNQSKKRKSAFQHLFLAIKHNVTPYLPPLRHHHRFHLVGITDGDATLPISAIPYREMGTVTTISTCVAPAPQNGYQQKGPTCDDSSAIQDAAAVVPIAKGESRQAVGEAPPLG
ncbi:hypothetical protein Taro_042998 [Colocasia esculenta]|uniref:Uncharacterized protein n=1 Tax=Colocasia esculenta TaxID=4460 RepID=A0A843WQZ7_COLES|nr:hypothetical protein [Colocasia esculenta]